MRSFAAFLLLALRVAAQLPNPVTSGDRFDITGTVVDSVTAKPLVGALVTLQPLASNARSQTSRTDISGNIAFRNVAVGTYTFSATMEGYAQSDGAGQKTILVSGTQPDRFSLALDPQSNLTGFVQGPGEKPIADAQVIAFRPEITAGHRRLATRASAKSDKNGHYHITGLGPGPCYVAAIAAAPSAQLAYPVTFSPNVTDPVAAQPIILRAGVEQQADIMLNPVPSFHIRGRVSPMTDSTNVNLLPTADLILKVLPAIGRSLDRKTGAFDLSGVPPGNYIAQGLTTDASNHETAGYRQVPVTGADVNDVSLNISAKPALSGTVHVDGDDRPETVVTSVGLQTPFDEFDTGGRGAAFTFDGVIPPGSYRLVTKLAPNWYVKSATQGGRDAVHARVVVSDDGSSQALLVTASPSGATIEATVTWPDTGHRVPAHVIVLESNDGEMLQIADVKVAPPNEPAVVRPALIGGLAPGQYVTYAWPEPLTVEYANPEALLPFDPFAQPVSLDEGQLVRVALKLAIP